MSSKEENTGVRRTREDLSSISSTESSIASPRAKSQKMADHEEAESVTIETLFTVLMEVQRNTNALLLDNKSLRKDLDEVKAGLSMQNTLVEEMKKENKELIAQVHDLKNSLQACQVQLKLADIRAERIEDKADDLEMYTRKSSLEIHGVPDDINEDLDDVVAKVAECIGVEIDEDDIDIVHRLPVKLKGIRPIIVKLKSHKVKSQIYFARRKLRGADLGSDLLNGAKQIYINENLTAQKRKLFTETRKKTKQYKWHNAWTVDGKVFVCKEKGDRPRKISNYSDLENIYV